MKENSNCPACINFKSTEISRVFIFIATITDKWLQNYEDLVGRLEDCDHEVELVDLTKFCYPPQVIDSATGLAKIEIQRRTVTPSRSKNTRLSGFVRQSPEELEYLSNEIRDAVGSEILTKYRGSLGIFWRPLLLLEKKLLMLKATFLFSTLQSFAHPKSVWIIPNGRLSHERAVSSFAELHSIRSLFLEESMVSRERYFLRTYRVHNRLALQEDVNRMKAAIPEMDLMYADAWYSDRTKNNSQSNPFSANFSEAESKGETQATRPIMAAMFTSSDDEIRSNGSTRSTLGWEDQYEAFEKLGYILANLGYQLTLRVHPNLKTKSAFAVKSEFKRLRWLQKRVPLRIVGPDSSISSYDLIQESSLVIVSVSTLGMEAISRKKKVIATANNQFDILGDSLEYSASENPRAVYNFLGMSSPSGESARHWVANQIFQDYIPSKERRSLPPNPLSSKLKYILRPTAQLYFLSLWAVNVSGHFSKRYYLWKLGRLQHAPELQTKSAE